MEWQQLKIIKEIVDNVNKLAVYQPILNNSCNKFFFLHTLCFANFYRYGSTRGHLTNTQRSCFCIEYFIDSDKTIKRSKQREKWNPFQANIGFYSAK